MRRDVALWTGVLGGPVIWALTFTAKFFLAYWICVYQWKPAVYIISAIALAVTAAAGAIAWSQWQQLRRDYPDEAGETIARSRTMAIAGVLSSGLFFIVVIANAIPELMMRGCE